jgi:polyisoprenoid-binding protein YceI
MRTALFAFSALVLAFSSPALTAESNLVSIDQIPAGVYASDPTHTSLTWKVNHLGLSNYTARFTKVDAEVTLDPADITKSTVKATIDPASVRTDFVPNDKVDFDKKLGTSADWFNAEKFPSITFTSTKIEKTGDKTAKIHGDLTFLGVTKPVALDATFNGAYVSKPFGNMPAFGVSATTQIKRSEWGFGTYVPTIGDDVQIAIELEFNKSDTPKAQ